MEPLPHIDAESAPRDIGSRLAQARRDAGLNQKALAKRLGVPLWRVAHLEAGRGDVSSFLPAIASVTERSVEWFRSSPSRERSALGRVRTDASSAHAEGADLGLWLVVAVIALLILIRFFTEVVPILPRALNFVDVPLLFALGLAAMVRPVKERPSMAFAVPVTVFLGICALSVAVNTSRVAVAPVLVFIYGFLAPFAVYAAVYRLWPVGRAHSLSRLLVGLGLVQLLVVVVIDLPRFLRSHDPDVISGTFGTNAYQLVFFLLVFTALIAGIATLEPGRASARLAPVLFALVMGTILLAQYRALLFTTAVTVVLIGVLLGGRTRGLVTVAAVAASFVFALWYVSTHFPALKFGSTIATFQSDPGYYASSRLDAMRKVLRLYSDEPRFMLTGTGPGTFSSRAWQTFARADSDSRSNVQGRYVSAVTGGEGYHTDVADKYVVPELSSGRVIGGSRAVTSPISSYSSLLAEVGVFGFLLIVAVYLTATARSIRMTLVAIRRRRPGDSLPSLLLACSVAFVVLLQMGLLQNWLEVARVTFIAWALLGVTSKEFDARYGDEG